MKIENKDNVCRYDCYGDSYKDPATLSSLTSSLNFLSNSNQDNATGIINDYFRNVRVRKNIDILILNMENKDKRSLHTRVNFIFVTPFPIGRGEEGTILNSNEFLFYKLGKEYKKVGGKARGKKINLVTNLKYIEHPCEHPSRNQNIKGGRGN